MRISDWSSDVCSSDLEEGFAALRRSVQDRWLDDLVVTVTTLSTVVQHADRIADRLAQPAPVSWSEPLDDVTRQLTRLVFGGMVVSIGTDRLAHVPRSLDAIDARLDKLRAGPATAVDPLRTLAPPEPAPPAPLPHPDPPPSPSAAPCPPAELRARLLHHP